MEVVHERLAATAPRIQRTHLRHQRAGRLRHRHRITATGLSGSVHRSGRSGAGTRQRVRVLLQD